MGTLTPNLSLLKPAPTDLINVTTQLDNNFDILDARVTDRNLYSSKGDILIGSATSDTPAKLAVGTEGQSLVSRAAATLGIQWESILPVGSIIPHGGTSATGYLLCDGSAYLRSTFAQLFSVIGTTYGPGDGSTTFNVPDLRGRALIGAGTGVYSGATNHALGSTGGEEKHTQLEVELAAHTHGGATGSESAPHTHTASTDTYNHSHGGTTGGENANHHHSIPQLAGTSGSHGLVDSGTASSSGNLPDTSGVSNDHGHGISNDGHGHAITVNNDSAPHTHTVASDGSSTPFNVMQPYCAINYLIKAF